MSGVRVNLKELTEKCNMQVESANVLHKKSTTCQPDSVSNVSTIEYLNKFRCEIGYQGSEGLPQPESLSSLEKKSYVDTNDDQKDGIEQANGQFNEVRLNRSLTLDEIKNGLHGLKRTGDGYSFTFTSVRLSGRELEDTSLVANFCNLKAIDISENCIKSIRNLGAMPYLRSINASKNQIDTFLDMTPVPVALKEVDFSFNLITSIVNMKKFWSLTDINLSRTSHPSQGIYEFRYNELTVIEGFSDLEYLQVLNLSYNKIDTIVNLDCPNLLILYLNYNCLKSLSGFLNCNNLRYINLNGNKISTLQGLRYMNELTELQIADNNIEDMSELENLKTILTLTRIRIDLNPISSLENWRLVLIHMLPQILWMDGHSLTAEELRSAENTFNPSFKKLAFVDHAAIMLDRACQAANHVFDEHCRTRPFPPVLLLVGAPKSQCHRMALLLKERFRNQVYLGGVHSTATTIEGSSPNSDIPVSHESFKEMKNRAEFLATSQILGRVCGFATSQIARAAEKGALLVAAVPLTTAISLREWNLQPKLVLILPTSPPEFPNDEERKETMKRNSLNKNDSILDITGSQKSVEEEEDEQTEKTEDLELEKDHLVNFADMLSVVPSLSHGSFGFENTGYPEPEEPFPLDGPQHSILKTPHFEIIFDGTSLLDQNSEESIPDRETVDFEHGAISKPKVSLKFLGEHKEELDLEKKRKARLKSLAPGLERYPSLSDADDDRDEDEGYDININGDNVMEIPDHELVKTKATEDVRVTIPNPLNNYKISEQQIKTSEGNAPRNVASRPRRMNRLASLLMLETDQRLDSSLNIADILMNLPSMKKVDRKLLETVNLSTATAQYHPEIIQTQIDKGDNPIPVVPLENEKLGQPRSTLIPPSFSILQDPSPLRAVPVGNQRFVENYDLIVAKEQAKKTKELDAYKRGERVKTSSDDAGVTPVGKEKKSGNLGNKSREEIKSEHQQDFHETSIHEDDDINKILANNDEAAESEHKSHKCKHHHKKCRSRKVSKNRESLVKSKKEKCNESTNPHQKLPGSKGQRSCSGKGHHKVKTLIGPSNAFDWRGRKIGEPEADLPPNFDRDIKRGVFYDGEFSKFAPEKSIIDLNPLHDSQNPPELEDQGDQEHFDDSNASNEAEGVSTELAFPTDNGQVEFPTAEMFTAASPQIDGVHGIQEGQVDFVAPKPEKNHRKKKGLRFEGSDEEKVSNVEIEKTTEVDTENSTESQEIGHNLPEDFNNSNPPEVKKIKEPVKMVESEGFKIGDRDDHHLRHTDALKTSIMQTREEYAEFNWDNPGFFHTILDTSDLCKGYKILEDLALELLVKYKTDSKAKDFLKASVKSHAGVNHIDEKCFLAERIKHFKNCASVWSQGYDSITAFNHRERDKEEVTKPCEIFFDKTPCPKGLLDPTLPRPGITLKMKRVVELHEKKIRCAKKYS